MLSSVCGAVVCVSLSRGRHQWRVLYDVLRAWWELQPLESLEAMRFVLLFFVPIQADLSYRTNNCTDPVKLPPCYSKC